MTVTRPHRRSTMPSVGALCVALTLMAGCNVVAPSQNPEASGARDLVIGVEKLPLLGDEVADLLTDRLVYSGLYRYDAAYQVQPDLADGPCVAGVDLLSLTCHLRPATFHDGSPVSAEDVAFSYQLAASEQCREGILCTHDSAIDRVETPDERTVVIVLREPDPSVVASILPNLWIERRAVTMAAYDLFQDQAKLVDRRAVSRLAKAMDAELARDEPLCERDLPEAERLLSSAGAIMPQRDEFTSGEVFSACDYAAALQFQLEAVDDALGTEGVDAVAAAYPILGLYRRPVGTGPWKVVSREPGHEIVLESFENYHFGQAKIPRVRLVAMSEGAALEKFKAGTLDWWKGARGDFGREVRGLENVRTVLYPILVYLALQYNLREGRLFSDLNLRKALELCIDKASSVDTVSGGLARVATSAIPPPMWAHKDEPIVERNVLEAKRLIESSGWRLAPDGTYVKNDQRLAASVVVRDPGVAGPFSVVNFLDLLVKQATDCGMDLRAYPVPLADINDMLDNFPHLAPGDDEPFDLYLGVVVRPPDPDDRMWDSSEIASAAHPYGANYIGFSNPDVDRALAAARRSTNIDERTRLYGTFQDIVFEQRAMLFVYWPFETTGLSKRVMTGDRPLDSEYWWWQLETLELGSVP